MIYMKLCRVWVVLGNSRGRYVIIKHSCNDDVFYAEYMHLSDTSLSVDDIVIKGQLIGYMGGSGKKNVIDQDGTKVKVASDTAYPVHLHFQTFTDMNNQNGSAFDPFSGRMYGDKMSIIKNGIYGYTSGNVPDESWLESLGYPSKENLSGIKNLDNLAMNVSEGLDYTNYFIKE